LTNSRLHEDHHDQTGGSMARIAVAMITGHSAVAPEGQHLLDAHDDGVHLVRGDQQRPEILVPAVDEEDDEERRDHWCATSAAGCR
jgi:hypothetical protein